MPAQDLPLLAAVFAVLAALIHTYIFVLESLRWIEPSTMRTFGVKTAEEAQTTRSLAYNQGFYNLFLALGALIGSLLASASEGVEEGIGTGMLLLSLGSMLAASLVLILSNRRLARAAAVQGVPPLIALVAMASLLA